MDLMIGTGATQQLHDSVILPLELCPLNDIWVDHLVKRLAEQRQMLHRIAVGETLGGVSSARSTE